MLKMLSVSTSISKDFCLVQAEHRGIRDVCDVAARFVVHLDGALHAVVVDELALHRVIRVLDRAVADQHAFGKGTGCLC